MSRDAADRNLLVGILALQMDFVSRDELIQAMNAWVLDKSRPLEQILQQRGSLGEDTVRLLLALVQKHLELHGGDPARSLQVVSTLGTARGALDALRDPDLAASLAQVALAPRAGDPNATWQASAAVTAAGESRFRILRFHDKGGLGLVHVARDEELNREVALKEIQPQFADDPESRERFLVEAEITGGLEHPGIVPIYGLGQYADGRPYYAMRFIRGDSLKEAIAQYHRAGAGSASAERAIAFRRLLQRFVDVCQAIEYAHRRGILHRDLKPGNIMLGKYGETLVVDWGLARPADQPATSADLAEPPLRPASGSGTLGERQGTRVGTLPYMSPEQSAGRIDLLNASSDVYSLGATLYTLLTGEVPFRGKDIEQVARDVEGGAFPRPREVQPQVPAALEAICLRAMAREQKDRYPAAAALAADVERWLADEAVLAWKEPLGVRFARWVRKHRTLVASTGTAMLTAIALLAASLYTISGYYRRELAQRQLAERYLAVARGAVDTMLTEVGSEALSDVPQMEEVRGELLAKAQGFYQQFSDQDPAEAELQLEVARAWHRLGDVYRITRQREAGVQAYSEAIRRLELLATALPDDAVYTRELANSHNWLGVLLKRDDPAAALKQYERAVGLLSGLARRDPSAQILQQLARARYNRGIVHGEAGRFAAAVADYRAAIDQLTEAIGDPANADLDGCRQELARCNNNLANVLERNEADQAREYRQLAVETMRGLVDQHPRRREYRTELATYHNNLANQQMRDSQRLETAGDPSAAKQAREAALVENRAAVALLRELAEPLPSIRDELGNALHSGGAIETSVGQGELAAESRREAEAIFAGLVAQHPDDPQYRDRLGNVLHEAGKVFFLAGEDYGRAAECAAQAAEHHERCLQARKDNELYREHLGNDYLLGAWSAAKLGRHATAVELAERFAELHTRAGLPARPEKLVLMAGEVLAWVPLIRADEKLASAERDPLAESLVGLATRLLEQAAAQGYADRESLVAAATPEGRFSVLRDRAEFQRILERLR